MDLKENIDFPDLGGLKYHLFTQRTSLELKH